MNKFISMEKKRTNDFEKNIKKLFDIEGKIKEIIIVSAYFDLKTLDWIDEYHKFNLNIRIKIFIDRYSSKIFSSQEIYNKLIDLSKRIDIFLVKSGKLFHSKLYYIRSNKKIKIYIGSLNFTYNAFQQNEEILNKYIENINKKSIYVSDIEGYINKLEDKSEKVSCGIENKYQNNNLRSLLLDGFIYFESKEQESFSFKLYLSDDVKKIDAKIDSTLEASIVDSLTLERLIKESSFIKNISYPTHNVGRSMWKNYCIETCYGYWSPSYFDTELNEELEKQKNRREPYFSQIEKILKENCKELDDAFLKVHANIKTKTEKNDWRYYDKDVAIKAWREWRRKLLKKFKNKKFYNRLIIGMTKVPSPDIWSDDIASEEFEDSFLNSLLYYWSKENDRVTIKKIPQRIAHNLKGRNSKFNKYYFDDSSKLKIEIEKWLEEYIDDDNNIFVEWDW